MSLARTVSRFLQFNRTMKNTRNGDMRIPGNLGKFIQSLHIMVYWFFCGKLFQLAACIVTQDNELLSLQPRGLFTSSSCICFCHWNNRNCPRVDATGNWHSCTHRIVCWLVTQGCMSCLWERFYNVGKQISCDMATFPSQINTKSFQTRSNSFSIKF